MRHRMKGRKLGRNGTHRKAMFKNMATSFILSARPNEDDPTGPKVPGRIVTTVAKAKELRPRVEKLITMARKARVHEQQAEEFATSAERGSDAWKNWRDGDQWQKWVNAKSPAVAMRRRAFSVLRSKEAVDVLFAELAERFESREGGYTRIVRLHTRRLGDGGQQAIIEFTGERDRTKSGRAKAPVVKKESAEPAANEPEAAPEATEDKSEA